MGGRAGRAGGWVGGGAGRGMCFDTMNLDHLDNEEMTAGSWRIGQSQHPPPAALLPKHSGF